MKRMLSFIRRFSTRKKRPSFYSKAVSEGIRDTFRAMGYRFLIAGTMICLTTGCIKDPYPLPVANRHPEKDALIDSSFEKPDLHANCQAAGENSSGIMTAGFFFMLITAIPLSHPKNGLSPERGSPISCLVST
jgi:hypothetical protein